MKYEMHLRETPFNEIKNGTKMVEIRLNDEKRKNIKKGDEICFKLNEEKINVEVIDVFYFSSFAELFASPLRDRCGAIRLTKEECIAQMAEYYSVEDEKKYGVLAIEIKLLPSDDLDLII